MSQLSEFLRMGGYAAYVWGAYGLSLAVLAVSAWLCVRREQRFLRTLAARRAPGTGT
jgi:heme exporter protein CcmD